MADSTTGVLRCADRALAGATGPLLLMGLASTTADFSTCLGRVGSLSSGSKLSHYNLVNEWNVDGDFLSLYTSQVYKTKIIKLQYNMNLIMSRLVLKGFDTFCRSSFWS